MSARWPDGSARSQGNAFDLSKREHSIFFDPKRPPPIQKQKFGKGPTSMVGAVKGLSKQARAQLSETGQSITIGKSDPDRGRRVRKASI